MAHYKRFTFALATPPVSFLPFWREGLEALVFLLNDWSV